MNINDLYNELTDSLDDFKSLLVKPSMRSPEIVQQLLLLTAELVKAIELNRRGHQDKLPAHLVDNVEESRVALNHWLDILEVPSDSAEEFRRKHEQRNYQLYDFLKDPSTLIVVMEKHSDYAEWFKRNFPNGASSAEEVVSKI